MSFRCTPRPQVEVETCEVGRVWGPQQQVSSVTSFDVGYEISENASHERKSE